MEHKKIIVILAVLTMLVSMVFAVKTISTGDDMLRTPAEFTTLTSTTVNFSTNYSQTDNAERHFSIKFYNSSDPSSTRRYDVIGIVNGTNGTLINASRTLVNDKRVWWYYNVTNITGGPVVSDVRLFDIDTDFLKFKFGGYLSLNFTLNKGSLDVTDNLTSALVRLKNSTVMSGENYASCDINSQGSIVYNSSVGVFLGCNGTKWSTFQMG